MGAPKNFYNAVDLAKFGIEDIDKRVLPQVTADNDGKIAKVVDGKWSLGDASGSEIIDCTVSSGNVVLPAGVTVTSIAEKYISGTITFLRISNNIYSLNKLQKSGSNYTLQFSSTPLIDSTKVPNTSIAWVTTFSSSSSETTSTSHKYYSSFVVKRVIDKLLSSHVTTLTFTHADITTNSVITVYSNVFGVDPIDIVVTEGSVTLTFDDHAGTVSIKLVVM